MILINEKDIPLIRGAGPIDKFLSSLRCKKANQLIPNDRRKGRILDIGCGIYPLFLLNTRFNEKYGIDRVVEGRSHKRWEEKGILCQEYDLEEDVVMPFEDNYFDVITMLAVFEHISVDKLIGQLKEIKRILKPEGVFIITLPAGWTDSMLRVMANLRLVSKKEFEDHKDEYNPSKVMTIYQKAGFIKEKIKTGYFELFMNMWVIATKQGI